MNQKEKIFRIKNNRKCRFQLENYKLEIEGKEKQKNENESKPFIIQKFTKLQQLPQPLQSPIFPNQKTTRRRQSISILRSRTKNNRREEKTPR